MKRLTHWLAKHLRICRQFARIGMIRKSQFRLEFVNQVVMDVVYYASQILFFEFLYEYTDTIAGWTLEEARVFIAFFFIADAFMMVWLGQAWHFTDDLKKGNLDPVRVRPASPIILYFFQRFSIEGLANMAIGGGYLAWALAQTSWSATPVSVALLAWSVVLAWWGRSFLTVLFSIIEFYVVGSGLSKFFEFFFGAFGERPLDIFTRRLRLFFVLAVPVGALAYVPAAIVLQRFDAREVALVSAWLIGMGLSVFGVWKWSFRKYESAMS